MSVFLILFINSANKERKENEREDKTRDSETNNSEDLNTGETKPGYKRFTLKGLSYRNIKNRDIGNFSGYVKAEPENIHDKYAVAIYRNDGKHLGYTPANYMTFQAYILENGGTSPAYGSIYKDDEGYYHGEVFVKFDSNFWYNKIPRSERVYKSPNCKKTKLSVSENAKDESFVGKFYGIGRLIDRDKFTPDEENHDEYPIRIFNESGAELGIAFTNEHGYNTIEDFAKDRELEVWGYIGINTYPKTNKKEYFGEVYIPIKFSPKRIEKTKEEFKNTKIKLRIKDK